MKRMDGPFTVETKEGLMSCADGFMAFDPITGHYWAVLASYAAIHYVSTGESP